MWLTIVELDLLCRREYKLQLDQHVSSSNTLHQDLLRLENQKKKKMDLPNGLSLSVISYETYPPPPAPPSRDEHGLLPLSKNRPSVAPGDHRRRRYWGKTLSKWYFGFDARLTLD